MSNPEITNLMQVAEAFYMLLSTILFLLIVWGIYDLKIEIEQLHKTLKKLLQHR